jgi:hypothetical protein
MKCSSRHLRWATRLMFLLIVGALALVEAFAQSADEYDVKSAFVFNFTKFVEWPNLPNSDSFKICMLGDDPFGGTLDRIVKGKVAYNQTIQIRRLKEPSEARQCQIVFVRGEEDTKAAKLLEAVRGMPVLTVSENRRFTKMGGMIVLYMKDGHVSVSINVQPAETAGLKISAKLMSLAKKDENEEP